jgi:signal transduction histidine kinase/CheY-like chemotaxis protein
MNKNTAGVEFEKLLCEKEKEIEAIYENSPIILLLLDENYKIKKNNRRFAEVAEKNGFSFRSARIGDVLACENVAKSPNGCGSSKSCATCGLRNAISGVLETGCPCCDLKTDLSAMEGGKKVGKTFLVSASRIFIEKTPHVFVSLIDMSEHIKLESQLLHVQKMDAMGQLAGGMAHDLNNMLQVITGYSSIIFSSLAANAPEREFIVEISKVSERGAALVKQMLAFSRKQPLQLEYLNLNRTVKDALSMLSRLIPANITIDFVPGHELGTVHADPVQMEQIVMNLCLNARDAMPDGGALCVETENTLLNRSYCKSHITASAGHYLLLSVTDNGVGMDRETLSHVFEPFYTTKRMGRGTGLGLSTVYGIVTQHKGMVNVYSEKDKGTTFKVYIPIVEAKAREIGTKILGPIRGGSECVLVADDDESVLWVLRHTLEDAGYKVITAVNGAEALEKFRGRSGEISMLVLDVVMPIKGGHEVYGELKSEYPHLKFLFSSGYSDNAIHKGHIIQDGIDFIPKPYAPDDLLRRVREILDRKK